ncbi:hypothetical protein, partial [Anaplasma phagocytophilum]|uniref:hypothetical protein n=1 Tax=Anaplasma phagocytophilum TaxID=948 RepID=UPI001E60A21C
LLEIISYTDPQITSLHLDITYALTYYFIRKRPCNTSTSGSSGIVATSSFLLLPSGYCSL